MTAVLNAAPIGANLRKTSARQETCARNKWQLLKVIEDIREPLGLKATSISVLRAMLSFIRSDEITANKDEQHICFASNAALAGRAHVSVQTIERHIMKLVELGLLSRRSSSNGKRWARRNHNGEIVLATGLSLLPLVRRYAEFQRMELTHKSRVHELTMLRDECSAALAKLKACCLNTAVLDTLKGRAQKLFRRKANGDALRSLLIDIKSVIGENEQLETDELRGTDPKIEGHKETDLNPSVEKKSPISIDVSSEQMERAYPKLCAELRYARSPHDCQRHMDDLATQLHLGALWLEIKSLGPALSFMILGYLLERIESIDRPQAYAKTLVAGLSIRHLDWRSLLKRPRSGDFASRRNSKGKLVEGCHFAVA